MPVSPARWLSYLWPIRIWRGRGAHGDLDLTWEYGRLVVNSANANQSFGSLHRVWRDALKDSGVRERVPHSVLILGYGAGSLAHILLKEWGLKTRITGVDHDEVMIQIARTYFRLKNEGAVDLFRSDAFAFAANCQEQFDLVAVDLFHDLDLAPGLEEGAFWAAIRRLVSDQGLLLVNTVVHDEKSGLRSARLRDELRLHFQEVQEQHYEGTNRVYIAL